MAEIEKKTKRYPTDLTDEEWARIEPFLPGAAKSGRPARTDLREVLNAIRYLARSYGGWRMLPKDFPPASTPTERPRREHSCACPVGRASYCWGCAMQRKMTGQHRNSSGLLIPRQISSFAFTADDRPDAFVRCSPPTIRCSPLMSRDGNKQLQTRHPGGEKLNFPLSMRLRDPRVATSIVANTHRRDNHS